MIYYNEDHDLLGEYLGAGLIQIEDGNVFMVLTERWVYICEL